MKILYVTTISNTVNAFLIPHIKMLIEEGHQVDLAFNLVQEVKKELLDYNVRIFQIPFNRSPISRDNIRAYKELKNLVLDEKYDIVHTHTPVASAIVRVVCKNIRDIKVFYTAHGFHFHKDAPLLNWFIYYPIEKYLAKYTDTLITINKEDYNRSKDNFQSNRIVYIPGVGIDLKKINNTEYIKVQKRKELNIPEHAFAILSVGELNKNKNHEVIIEALNHVKNSNIHYLICGEGPLEDYLRDLSIKFGLENNVHILGFRNDVYEIIDAIDVFAFPSKREGLGLAAIEAMSLNKPLITSNIHGIVDYSIHEFNAFNCKSDSARNFSKFIKTLVDDRKLGVKMGSRNIEIIERYNLEFVLKKINELYYEEKNEC